MIKCSFVCILLLLLMSLSACSPTAPSVQKRFFFPPAPAEPKIEFIKVYFSDHDLKPKTKSFMTKYVLGEARAEALFTTPVDVASNGKGKVFVADFGLRQVIVLDLKNQSSRVLASSALARGGGRVFGGPIGVTVAADGKLYVCDVVTKGVDVFDENETYLFTLSHPDLTRPTAVAIDLLRRVIYVVDTASHRIAKFNLSGELIGYMGARGSAPGQFNFPTDVDVDEQGNVYVLDSLNARVQVFDTSGEFLRMFGERGTAAGSFEIPKSLAVSSSGQVYVTDALAHKLVVFSREGDFLSRIGGKSVVRKGVSPGGFYLPRGVAADDAGGVWVVDSLNKMVHRFQFLTPQYLREHPID